jgi:hypothetical protein
MPDAEGKILVAILAYTEVTASVVFAMHDLLSAAGRDWAYITSGIPGMQRMLPYIVSARKSEVLTANGAWIKTDYGFDDCPPPDIAACPTSLCRRTIPASVGLIGKSHGCAIAMKRERHWPVHALAR